jgi:hypothetical protein
MYNVIKCTSNFVCGRGGMVYCDFVLDEGEGEMIAGGERE